LSSLHREFIFSNNIFLGSDTPLSGKSAGSSFLGNVWWNSGNEDFMGYKSFSEWAIKSGQEMHAGHLVGMHSDPMVKGPLLTGITDPYQLVNLECYTLLPGSPVKNKGQDIKTIYKITGAIRDFYGTPVPQGGAPEPGIFEMK
jgi:hypothetical protein